MIPPKPTKEILNRNMISNSCNATMESSEQVTPSSCRSFNVVSNSSFKPGKDPIRERVSSSKNNTTQVVVYKSTKTKQIRKKKNSHNKGGAAGRGSVTTKLCSIANSSISFQPPSPIPEEVDSEAAIHEARNSNSLQQLLVCTELEDEVSALHKQLEQEQELHTVMEKALIDLGMMPNNVPSHLPVAEQELLLDVAILELEVLKLETQMSQLQGQLAYERSENEAVELLSIQVPSSQASNQQEDSHPIPVQPSSLILYNRLPQQLGEVSRYRVTLKELLHIPCDVASDDDCLQLLSPPHQSFSSSNRTTSQEILPCQSTCTSSLTKECHSSLESPSQVKASAVTLKGKQHLALSDKKRLQPSKNSSRLVPVQENQVLTPPFRTQGPQSPSTSPAKSEKKQLGLELCVVSSPTTPNDWPELLPSPKHHSIWSVLPDDDHTTSSSPPPSSSSSQTTSMPTNFSNVATQTESCLEATNSPSQIKKRKMYRSHIMKIRELWSQGLTEDSSEKFNVATSCAIENFSRGEEESASSRSESQKPADEDFGNFRWTSHEPLNPNQLSEAMVRCMAKIFCHLGMPSSNARLLPQGNQSPTSHLGNLTESSSLSSVSDSSLSSFVQSPIVCCHKEENLMSTNATASDLYKSRGKLSCADVGPYNHVLEVRWLSVNREQLEYAAQGLGKYRLLVEHLENVNPLKLCHKQKLAFWINIYNALLMHAFLAYGIPGSDLKFFSVMRKAAYCVGGHWFNAAVIESCLLKGKAMAHRPQFGLMMTLQKNKLKQEFIKYGINHSEPLVNFALCCGAEFSPMVRVYSAEHVHEELRYAVHSYARATVGISDKGKLLVPKLLYCYAHEIVEDRVLLDWVCNFLPSTQVTFIFESIQQHGRGLHVQSNNFLVLPFDFSFRYLFPSDICRSLR